MWTAQSRKRFSLAANRSYHDVGDVFERCSRKPCRGCNHVALDITG